MLQHQLVESQQAAKLSNEHARRQEAENLSLKADLAEIRSALRELRSKIEQAAALTRDAA